MSTLSLRHTLSLFRSPEIRPMYFLGFASGLPLALIISALSIRLLEAGIDKTTIGLFAAVGTPYTLKFLWAPLVDHLPLPYLTRKLGQRRAWILLSQILIMISLLLLGAHDPAMNPWLTAFFAVAVAFWSATQDIVIDAYRIESIQQPELQNHAISAIVFGYNMARLISGGGALILSEYVSWAMTYTLMALLMFCGIVTTLLLKESDGGRISERSRDVGYWIKRVVIMPFTDFASRERAWALVLLFVIFYKFGDTFAGVMTSVFVYDIGFSKSEIAVILKFYGIVAVAFGALLGAYFMHRYGMWRGLWIAGFLQMASNLMFVWQANVGADTSLLVLTITVENIAGGLGTAAFVAYISRYCKIPFTATQYALLSSLSAVGRTLITSTVFLGDKITAEAPFIDQIGWANFFLITTFCAIPGLMLLAILHYRDVKHRG